MGEIITRDYLLSKIKECIDSEITTPRDKLAAIKLGGEAINMFRDQAALDLMTLLKQMSTKELKGLRNVGRLNSQNDPIEVQGTVLSRTPLDFPDPDPTSCGLPIEIVTGGERKSGQARSKNKRSRRNLPRHPVDQGSSEG